MFAFQLLKGIGNVDHLDLLKRELDFEPKLVGARIS